MAIVAGGIVDQHVAATDLADHLFESRHIALDIGDVAMAEDWWHLGVGVARNQRFALCLLHVHERHCRALRNKALHDAFADA